MFSASDQVEVCDLLFRQVGCTSSQPEISLRPFIPFLTVVDLNLFTTELIQLLNIHHLTPFLDTGIVYRDKTLWNRLV